MTRPSALWRALHNRSKESWRDVENFTLTTEYSNLV